MEKRHRHFCGRAKKGSTGGRKTGVGASGADAFTGGTKIRKQLLRDTTAKRGEKQKK